MSRSRKAGSAQARTLERAAELVGGLAALAAHLGATELALREWLEASSEEIPDAVFLAALEIVLTHLEGGSPRRH